MNLTGEAKNVLTDALETLLRDGWCQGTAHNMLGQHCALGAVEEGVRAQPWYSPDRVARVEIPIPSRELRVYQEAVGLLRKVIGLQPDNMGSVTQWNDAPGRTFEDVGLAFKRAIHDD